MSTDTDNEFSSWSLTSCYNTHLAIHDVHGIYKLLYTGKCHCFGFEHYSGFAEVCLGQMFGKGMACPCLSFVFLMMPLLKLNIVCNSRKKLYSMTLGRTVFPVCKKLESTKSHTKQYPPHCNIRMTFYNALFFVGNNILNVYSSAFLSFYVFFGSSSLQHPMSEFEYFIFCLSFFDKKSDS